MAEHLQNSDDLGEYLKSLLKVDKSQQNLKSDLLDSLKVRPTLFGENGPCTGIPLEAYPDKYFVAQEFNETKNDLRETLAAALHELGFSPIAADDFLWTEKLLCKIAALIQGTPFGIYQLSTNQNRNVYLELGIAIGLQKPFVLVKDRDATPATMIRDIEYYQIDDYLSARYKLGRLLEKYIASVGQYRPKDVIMPISSKKAVLSHWESESVDITVVIAKQLKSAGFAPVVIGKRDQKLEEYLVSDAKVDSPEFAETRDSIFKAISSSRFGVFHIDKPSSANNFLALGFTIGLNRPFLPIKNARNEPPTDLNYLSPLEYSGFTDLGKKLHTRLPDWLSRLDNEG